MGDSIPWAGKPERSQRQGRTQEAWLSFSPLPAGVGHPGKATGDVSRTSQLGLPDKLQGAQLIGMLNYSNKNFEFLKYKVIPNIPWDIVILKTCPWSI